MKIILELIFKLFRVTSCQYAIRQTKRRGLILYLKSLQVIRFSIIGILLFLFLFQIMTLGLLGSIILGVSLLPIEESMKHWILFTIFALLFLIPATVLFFVLSERIWYKFSGAQKMISEEN